MGLTTDDQLAIQGLAARYNHAIDSGDAAAYADTFVETGVLDAGVLQLEGRAALGQFAAGFPSAARAPRHVTSNLVIDGDGTEATLDAYVQMYVLTGEPATQVVAASGKYSDRLTKADGTWRFVRRTYTADS